MHLDFTQRDELLDDNNMTIQQGVIGALHSLLSLRERMEVLHHLLVSVRGGRVAGSEKVQPPLV